MMSLLATATLALGFFANAALAGGYTDADMTTTETQEIGSTTSEGAIWYSMNVCEIVQHTQCDVSLSQGGAAPPPEETGGEGDYPPPPAPEPSVPASNEPEYSPPPPSEGPSPTEGGEQPPSSGVEPAPTDGDEQPPPSEEPSPSEGGDQPVPTGLTTTNEAGDETTVPATTNSGGSVHASGTVTGEPSSSSSASDAITLIPAAVPAMAVGVMAFFMIAA